MDLEWVGSLGGPLIVVPVAALADWHGADGAEEVGASGDGAGEGGVDDYARACAVPDLAGVIPVGRTAALVLGDDPADTCYLAEQRVFVRWMAADSAEDLVAAAHAALADPGVEWDECGRWDVDGPAVLMDSAFAGAELDLVLGDGSRPARAAVPVPAGRWRVQAAQRTGGDTWVGLVRLLPAGGEGGGGVAEHG
ncbi:hypothetical protein SUDANB95_04317 [Actinosynnema sp. ALI-1.44]